MTKQFVWACHKADHPCSSMLTTAAPPRNIRRTAKKFVAEIANITATNNTRNDDPTYKRGLKQIHTNAVQTVLNEYSPNKILGVAPPKIAIEEEDLPRSTRCTLAQLRSGWSRMLQSYLHRLDSEVPDNCPECGSAPHNVDHLFVCPRNPTNLTKEDLWLRPRAVADFLNLKTDEE